MLTFPNISVLITQNDLEEHYYKHFEPSFRHLRNVVVMTFREQTSTTSSSPWMI